MKKETVIIGMSGGVDSSLSAVLLKEAGYNVIGLFMKNWEEPSGECNSAAEFDDVVRVCDQIGISYYSVNFVKEYRDQVFQHFLRELEQGYTPNPDILCNREIKFKVLLDKAIEIGGDYLATGHYCRSSQENGTWRLLKGSDRSKDQSYFLYTIGQYPLSRTLFPIGGMLKSEVREIARKHNLATSEKKDSTGICFIGERKIKEFLSNYITHKPGNLVTLDGTIVGQHLGLHNYTIGQRKGMGLGGEGEAWYVVGKDIPGNNVIVVRGDRHPALFCDWLTATEASWVQGQAPQFPMECTCKIRYRQEDQPCVITGYQDGVLRVEFPSPQRAVTPRQSIVFYRGDECLGGAMIERAGPSYHDQGKPTR